ncbi:SAGA HAT/Core module component [Orbilia oligospora]|uniref:SAGA HAT/Core module component n=1 Tax=Orbilia oligospora TaxID=2813651 RepID=A0A7C8J1M8_ORBOL|nr:SAGA HAT/Core module component [Orbilia oligospora]KAF3086861.1 SAGA HAT/Core module component [Orbilia oligospora]KAF3088633.1 SAGA HAT/Core module component [Orbilia oligospora]KAF3088634.1 SAGA HAT/Core module component, variant 2 [Orbilia oligospora]KAF3118886.1 SAGA HAT/Core module component [Orbilia oligospora]
MSQRGNRLMHQPEQQEERSLWQKVVNELKALMAHEAKVNDIRRKIDTLEERNRRHDATSADLQELATCYKGLKALTDEESRLLSHVIEHNLSILIGLRKATEQGYGSSGTGRDGFSKRKRNEAVSVDSSASRGKPRSMSVPNENGPVLQVGSQVAFRLPKQKGAEGEWIQCDVINIIGEGNKRRYEVQDPEPDELGKHGQQIYKAVAHQLIQIPSDSAGLLPYPNGKQVLARYPETTTFYKAEVIGTKRDGTCRLKFEGEEEVGKETEVERRLVLEIVVDRRNL